MIRCIAPYRRYQIILHFEWYLQSGLDKNHWFFAYKTNGFYEEKNKLTMVSSVFIGLFGFNTFLMMFQFNYTI